MRTAMRLSTLSAPLASFAANSKPFFPLFFAWVSPLPPSGEGQREERRVGLLPHRPHRAELASELWDPVGWCVGRVRFLDVLHTLPFYF